MKTNKPPPPPGLPTTSQRIAAIQLASRAHASPKATVVSNGHALILPAQPSRSKPPLPSMITVTRILEDEDVKDDSNADTLDEGRDAASRVCMNVGPRFMRIKNNDKSEDVRS